ncbi:MAG TPA: T9SS type A sorting domain-containing protein [Bacteroidia bacterium]
MKKHILLLLTLLFVFKVGQGQTNVYHPFPNDSANWAYRFSQSTGESIKTAHWLGDTIINLKTYTKVFGNYGLIGIRGNVGNVIGVRQDTMNEKVYSINSSGLETDVSVSQHLIVGDTFPSFVFGGSYTIQSIDSSLFNNKYHKVYNLQNGNVYTVGFGIAYENGFEFVSQILCFNIGRPMLYSLTPPFCVNNSSINQIKNNESFVTVSPNPTSTILNVECLMVNESNTLIMTDMLGNTMYHSIFTTQHNTINVADLDAGVYFITLTSDTTTSTKKVIVTK